MKLALFQKDADILPGVITESGIVDVADLVPRCATPQLTMTGMIDDFDRLRPQLERRARDGAAIPLDTVRLRAPLPRPGKILACIANYWEHGALAARPLNMFLKNPDAVIGPGSICGQRAVSCARSSRSCRTPSLASVRSVAVVSGSSSRAIQRTPEGWKSSLRPARASSARQSSSDRSDQRV